MTTELFSRSRRTARTALTLRDMQAVLRPDELLLEMALAEPASFAIVVSRSSARVQRIASRSTILGQASALVSAARSGRGVTNEAKALSATILTSIRELSSHRRVIISAEGSLQQVPFELLEHAPPSGRRLLDTHVVSYTPSAGILVMLRTRPASPSGMRMALAVGASPEPAAVGTSGSSPGPVTRGVYERTNPISAAGPLHPLLEGTVIDTVLTNRLDGSGTSPVNCLVTNPVFSHSGQHVLIPAGARVLGETRPVQALGETRLAVAFHRLLMPDGSTLRLDQFMGLNQIGDAGLRDKVNHHYWSTFGSAGAVGLISGLAQWIGSAGFSGGTGDRTVIIAGGADAASQASLQVMSRFLNRLPAITIREGHRVKAYLTSDLQLPAYQAREGASVSSGSRRPQ
jgi:hypothetical protein